jgi:hypothetical protein
MSHWNYYSSLPSSSPLFLCICFVFVYLYCFCVLFMFLCWVYNWHLSCWACTLINTKLYHHHHHHHILVSTVLLYHWVMPFCMLPIPWSFTSVVWIPRYSGPPPLHIVQMIERPPYLKCWKVFVTVVLNLRLWRIGLQIWSLITQYKESESQR